MKKLLLSACFIAICLFSFSQKNKTKTDTTILTADEVKALNKQLGIDSSTFLRSSAHTACNCIDSIDQAEKDKKKKLEGFSACIDNAAFVYEGLLGILSNKFTLTIDKDSKAHKQFYYDIERWLKDSCKTLNVVINSNDIEREKSFSNNPEATNAYNKGVILMSDENYTDAIPWFEKAVSLDSEFAFAWDNLGISYRKMNNLGKAEAAYKSSLKVDPGGKTPLQNLAVVYQMQNKSDEAIATYKEILKYYPDDPEVFYGIAMVYFNVKKDMEKALDNMCAAYNIYVEQKSPFRSDAEKVINMIYSQLKKENKEDVFFRILKEHNIKTN
jgi:tetratricopeptide (TPR) repeat protein